VMRDVAREIPAKPARGDKGATDAED
jgi:hypothetical protein